MAFDAIFKTDYKKGTPLRAIANAQDMNRLRSGWNNLSGQGCHIEKSVVGGELYVTVIVDGLSDTDVPDSFSSSDQLVAVDSLDTPAYLKEQFYTVDTNGSTSDDITISWEVLTESSDRKMKLYAPVDGTGQFSAFLAKDTSASLKWESPSSSADNFSYFLIKDTGSSLKWASPGSGTPSHVLGKTSSGSLVWVPVTDTCG